MASERRLTFGTVAELYGDATFDAAATKTAVEPVPLELQQALAPVVMALAYGSHDVSTALGPTASLAALSYWIRGEGTFDTSVLPALDKADVGAIATAATQLATAVEAARLARSRGLRTLADNTFATPFAQSPLALGVDVVVVDHHQADEALPPAVAIVNPNRRDDLSGLGHLAAVGLTFMTVVAVNRLLRSRGFWTAGRPEPRHGAN